jgi:eukaryotic-like serine/threonine-protein kinase
MADPDPTMQASPDGSFDRATSSPGLDRSNESVPGSASEAGALLAERYEIRALLGVGGMGRVYRAWDRELDEDVAIKMLEANLDERAIARFRKEVKLARTVTHRNVARTYDIGEHEGQRFLTMELIEGVALDRMIAQRAPLALAEARAILVQIAEGLAAAHAVQVVHRDLKPSNVMIDTSGRVAVTDFGLARRSVPDAETIGFAGQVLGTPAYMAPEQVAGVVEIDARADVYALGLIAHELLFGQPAFRGRSPLEVAAARLYEPPPSFAGVASPLRELLRRCVAREPEDRLADARELLAGLRADAASSSGLALPLALEPSRDTRVAVLPFAHGRDGEELLEGLAEDLADVLSMTAGLRVRHGLGDRDRASDDPIAAGRDAGVDVVVTGSVRRQGDQLRVRVRVLGTADGYQLWAGRFDRRLEQALAINDEVAQAVAKALSTHAPAARSGPSDPRAVELYLLARKLAAQNFMHRGRTHIEPLDRALSLAPDDPLLVGMWIFHRVAGRNFDPFGVDPEVEAALARLVERAPELLGTHLARAAVAIYGHDDRAASVVWLRRAQALAAHHPDVSYLLATANYEAGRLDAAAELLRRVLWQEPGLPWVRTAAAMILGLQGRWTAVVDLIDEHEADPWQRPRVIALARTSLWAGRELAPFEIDSVDEPMFARMVRLQVAAVRGESIAEAIDASYRDHRATNPCHSRGGRLFGQLHAELFAAIGANIRAIEVVTETVADGLIDAAWFDLPLLDPLRGDPSFEHARAAALSRARALAAALDAPLV